MIISIAQWIIIIFLKSADILKPLYFQLISPVAWLFGAALIYAVI